MLRTILEALRKDSRGQDLAEYCLITALVALVGLGIFIYVSGGVQSIWNTASSQLVAGNASSQTGGAGTGGATSH